MSLYQVILTAVDTATPQNPFVNAFYYDVNDVLPSSGVALALAEKFSEVVLDDTSGIPATLVPATVQQSVVVTCPFDPTVIGIDVINIPGVRTGTAMPRFVAWGFKQQRLRADIRAGFKRFGRISESDTGGDVPTPGMLTALNTLASVISTELTVLFGPDEFTATPVIVKRIPYVTPEGNDAYRLPNSPLEYQFYQAMTWNFQAITTQNSRKN